MNWVILIVAGMFESGFAFCLGKMKEVSGTAWWLWGAGFIICLSLSMILLAKAVQTLPIFFNEPASFLRLFFITTLIASIIGLKIVS